MTAKQIALIESNLRYTFTNKKILERAFTHSSYANAENVKDNERMEFLGDAILDMIVSEYLYGVYGDCSVGALSTMRANIVSANALRPVVEALDVMPFLQVGGGASNIKKSSKKIESNLYEAVVSAIYLDSGLESAKEFVLRTLRPLLDEPSRVEQRDGKTVLQEHCQKHRLPIPEYRLAERIGLDNDPTFKCDLYIENVLMCSGVGSTKKAAEQDAAKKLIIEWRI